MANRVSSTAIGAILLFIPGMLEAQAPEIGHTPIGCVVAGKYPRLNACFTPNSQVARARVYFRAEGVRDWYYVEMASDVPCYAAALLRPSRKLAEQKKRLEYYVEVTSRKMDVGRTQQYDPLIVASADECRKDTPAAPFAQAAPAAVFPSVPAGFVTGGVSTAAIVGAGVAVAGGTGALLAGNSGNGSATPTTVAPTTLMPAPSATLPSPASPPAPSPGPTPTPAPGPSPAPTPTPPINYTLTLTKPLLPPGTGRVTDNKGQINCGTLCLGTSATYPAGTNIVLLANPDPLMAFAGWGGQCSGTDPTCQFVMNADKNVTASFSVLGLLTSDPPVAAQALDWAIELDVPDAVGQVVLNGHVVRTARGQSQAPASAREGDNLVEAQLIEARDKSGTWRFEAQGETIQPGSLRVVRGEVALVTPTAVVFRMRGKRGEEVSFSYRLQN